MLLVIICFLLIVFTLSYFLLWLIYRKLFESQEQISIALTFVVSIGLVMLFVYPPMVFFYFLFFTLSYIIWWLIYRKLFKSQKHISKFLVVLGSIGLIMFYYTPYSFYLEPSYWQFRNMCKLNELPNNEEKYNKILRYFDLSLDTLDWEELNEKALKLTKGFNLDYIEGRLEYRVKVAKLQKQRYNISVDLYTNTNNKGFSKETITHIETYGSWKTRRYFPDGNEGSGFYWREETLSCSNFIQK